MTTPKIVVFFIYSETTGEPLPGAFPIFTTYNDDTGAPVAPPAITEIGGGAYRFTPVFTAGKGLVYTIDSAIGAAPRFQSGFLRAEDYNIDILTDLGDELLGKWQLVTVGPDANRLVLYRQDNSVLKKFDLADASDVPTFTNPFKRTPVP